MRTAITTGILTVASAVGFGTLAFGAGQTATATGSDDVILNKREDTAVQWVVADDDDGDDNTRSRTEGPSHDNTNSASHDSTNSRFTAVSRDRDRSRGDLTRDWTRDGGDRTKDKSRHHTNDRSRNDTRRNWR